MSMLHTTAGKGIALAAVLLLAGAGVWYFAVPRAPAPVACTAEAMQCPDGSYVGRTGPNCQFVCPPVATTTATTTPTPTPGGSGAPGILPYNSGIKGTVLAGPTCPVERNPPDPACADKPLATTVTVFYKTNVTHAFASAQSNSKGAFTFALPPGEYVVRAAGGKVLPRCTDTTATVGPSGYTTVVVECDTGIR